VPTLAATTAAAIASPVNVAAAAPNTVEPSDAQSYAPAPKALMSLTDANAHHVAGTSAPQTTNSAEAIKLPVPAVSSATVALAPISNSGAALKPAAANLTTKTEAATPPAANTTTTGNNNNSASPVPAAEKNVTPPVATTTVASVAAPATSAPMATMTEGGTQLYLLSGQKEMRVGERQRLMLLVKTTTPLGLAAATLRFDPRFVAVRGVTQGSLFGEAKEAWPSITPSIDARGSLLALIAPAASAPINGMGVLLFVEIEALSAGESDVTLDQAGIHLMSVSGQNVATQLAHTRLTVKQ
jgi:hypothetical protein